MSGETKAGEAMGRRSDFSPDAPVSVAPGREEFEDIKMPSAEDWAEAFVTDDEDDPNYRYTNRDTMEKVFAAYNDLPDGWKRVRDKHGRHMFVHADGRTSFRNPARENVKRVLSEMEAENPPLWKKSKSFNIKKLQRMIKAGTPLHAVENQARLDGVDMEEVMAYEEEEEEQQQEGPKEKTTEGDAVGGGDAKKDRLELRRLLKMLSSGVPLPAVLQQARLRGVDPDLVAREAEKAAKEGGEADGGTVRVKEEGEKNHPPKKMKVMNPPGHGSAWQVRKLRKMIKAGIPERAVERQAALYGIGMEAVQEECPSSPSDEEDAEGAIADCPELMRLRKMLLSGVPLLAVQQQARLRGVDPSLLVENKVDDNEDGAKTDDDDGAATAKPLFILVEEEKGAKLVEFNPPDSVLALIVKKSVQTLKSRGTRPGMPLSVELRKDLYNALGILRAVRREQDDYNRAVVAVEGDLESSSSMSEDALRALRRPFLERLSSVGARPNGNLSRGETADVEGLVDLVRLIESECSDLIQAHAALMEGGTYDFNSLGEWFAPGSRAVARDAFSTGSDILCEVTRSYYEEGRTLFGVTRRFRVGFRFYAFVSGGEGGGKFTPVEFAESMESFAGSRNVRTLPFVPLGGLGQEDTGKVLDRLRKRGEMYVRCAKGGATFLHYDEGSFFPKAAGSTRLSAFGHNSHAAAQRTSGRVMVDCQGSYEAGHGVSVGYDPMIGAIQSKQKEYMLHLRRMKQASSSSVGGANAGPSASNDNDGMILFSSLPDDLPAMTWPALVGFSFTSKTWGDVLVDGLSEIDFNETAFDKLVLPPARKRMIKALVRHSSKRGTFSDIIAGKGEGSVFLLYGPPGTGKTLTAEAISEMMRRPLYAVSLGQLGTSPAELESRLSEILDLCGGWDALVLLDEADIFLEKRASSVSGGGSSLERNAMVSVMLRLVEYFRGTLFLTSNRVDALDPAFKTRITLALRYDPLGREARAEVWSNLLRASGHAYDVDGGRIVPSVLARHELNGREIKNAVRLAMALAEEDGAEALGMEYIEETAGILMEFNDKLESAEEY
eukprot:CAMPEP_0113549958 /NCGR_PEP_ID=MMETSP0015_2-20120614/13722_1 /TAXON_ID=2838 /ORGANISM="Odontella" /LENGTH=1061 /DNA_ID=CAMNT_0000450725 /DNA_START=132 /DNA_END=3317 /DNA_ORIENTATION=- /assembly_acc=CAM_ASM_000160